MAVLTDWAALATQDAWERTHHRPTGTDDALALYHRIELEPRDRMEDADRTALEARIATGGS
jgi:hypothetical protein